MRAKKTKDSILQCRKEDYLYRRLYDLEVAPRDATGNYWLDKHHIYDGPRRKISDMYGFWVYLIPPNHTGANKKDNPMGVLGVHSNRELRLMLQQDCQRAFEEMYSHDEFMRLIGKNYL